jgi:5,10-methylenetetrahydromethanopterin reductase
MQIRFGINFLPNAPHDVVEWARTAETCGFDMVGIADSQSLYRDVYVCAALCAVNTERIRFGPRVINPLTRHPAVAASAALTLEELAPGRTVLGIGSGDSAVYNIGRAGSTLAELRDYLLAVRGLLRDGVVDYEGRPARLTWGRADVPLYIAASGPKTLRLAGQVADGVVINTGLLPEIVRDSIEQVRLGAVEAGRDPAVVDLWWLPLTNLADDRRAAIEEITMSLASAGSHLSRFTTVGKHIPPELLDKVRELGARYHFDQHSKPNSANRQLIAELGLVDYLADRFAVAGTADDCIRKLEQAVAAGARQFGMSVHFDDKARFMRDWSSRVMPAFR